MKHAKRVYSQKGDLVILTFNPSAGHKQQGRHPARILSNESFNKALGLAIACPITNTNRDFPFHVEVKSENLTGFIMTEQIKSIDYKVRKAKFVEKVGDNVLAKVLGITESIIF